MCFFSQLLKFIAIINRRSDTRESESCDMFSFVIAVSASVVSSLVIAASVSFVCSPTFQAFVSVQLLLLLLCFDWWWFLQVASFGYAYFAYIQNLKVSNAFSNWIRILRGITLLWKFNYSMYSCHFLKNSVFVKSPFKFLSCSFLSLSPV